MGPLDRVRRLERLEERAASTDRASELCEQAHWILRTRARQERRMTTDVRDARSLIRLFRVQGILPEMSTEELVERIVSWRPVPEGGRSQTTAEREVALAIYNQEPGTENMVCPDEWRKSFVCGDELREKYAAIPDEVLAEGCLSFEQIEEGDEGELEKWRGRYEESFGIAEELARGAIGPDVDEITEEGCRRRLEEYLDDVFSGERGWRIYRHMQQLAKKGEQ